MKIRALDSARGAVVVEQGHAITGSGEASTPPQGSGFGANFGATFGA